MRELNTIQTQEKLNDIYAVDDAGPGNASHLYAIVKSSDSKVVNATDIQHVSLLTTIEFQKGPRKLDDSISGVIDSDLLEIVRDRLKAFQSGEFATRENAIALTHIEEALMWMNKRVEDRINRGVLGTNQK